MAAESFSSLFGSRKSGETIGDTAASSSTTDDIERVIVVISIKIGPLRLPEGRVFYSIYCYGGMLITDYYYLKSLPLGGDGGGL